MKEGGRVCCRKNLENLNILVTLDEISETAIEKMMCSKNSKIRKCEGFIGDAIHEHTKLALRMQEHEVVNCIENTSGRILDITSEMNKVCFKDGLKTGASLVLELLNIL